MTLQQSTAGQYLKGLQERCMRSGYVPQYRFESIPHLLNQAEHRGMRSIGGISIDDHRKHFAEINSMRLPTDLENPTFYAIVNECANDVHRYAKAMGYEAPTEICYGTLPTDDVNGMAIKPPLGDGVIIVLNHGTILALMQMAKAVASFFAFKPSSVDGAFEFASTSDFDRRFEEHLRGHVSFVESACSLIGLRISITPAEPLTSAADLWEHGRERVGLILSDHSTMFVVAHEYAHVALGHSSANVVSHRIQNIPVEKITRNWQQEIDADEMGSAIVLMYCLEHGQTFATMFAGVEFFLLCADLVERMLGVEFSSSHPPASRRRDRIRKAFATAQPDIAQEALATGDIMERIFSNLWERNWIHIGKAVEQYVQRLRDDPPQASI